MAWSAIGLNLKGPKGDKGDTGDPGTTSWSGITDKPTLGTAAATDASAYATAAQGTKADSAVQPGGALGTPSSGNLANCTFPTLNQSTTGNAATATKLATARTLRTNLASTSTANFDGSANATPGVTGTLPVGNGGTGATTLTGLVKGSGTSALSAATAGTDYVAPAGAGSVVVGTLPGSGVTGVLYVVP